MSSRLVFLQHVRFGLNCLKCVACNPRLSIHRTKQLNIINFSNRYPHLEFTQGYGLTETMVAMMTPAKSKKYASVGIPISGSEAKIINPNNASGIGLGHRESGELCIRGPQTMLGYVNNEEATKEMSLAGGWLRTGDIGFYDDEGFFTITDRIKELIKVQGFQVAPAELEEILRDHQDVLDAAVIGIPHEQYGEVPKAFIVCKPNTVVNEEELKQFVAKKVVKYKRIEGGIQFIDEIPKNVAGKILRRELKLRYC